MRVVRGVDQLHIHAHLVVGFLHAAFENIGDTQLLRDGSEVIRCTFILLRGSARNDFQVRDFGQSSQNFVLHALGKKGIPLFFAKIVERQNRDRFGW